MSSSVFFKFKSQKEPTRVEFDGTGISVFELKRDIILKSGLGDGTDFDLAIYSEDGSEEYDDDTTIIQRSTTVMARRLPPIKPGAGRAARYVSGKMPVTAKNSSRKEQATKTAAAKATSNALTQMSNALTEEEKMAAMFQAQTESWSAQQQEMAHAPAMYNNNNSGKPRRPANVPDHDPPNGYICYRCGEKGHWIQMCPTNDDPEYNNRPRVKRTTGIPKSFLKTVDKATVMAAQSASGDDEPAKRPAGIMVNADGEFVVAETDKKAWEKFQELTQSSAAAAAKAGDGTVEDGEAAGRGLLCALDKKIFIDPMKTPCCEKTYCNDCITNALIESDFVCPACRTEGVLIDDLKQDDDMIEKVKQYLKEKKEKAGGGDAKSPAAAAPTAAEDADKKDEPATDGAEKAKSPAPESNGSKSPTKKEATPAADSGDAAKSDDGNPKKRPAEESLENNPKIPKGPKAMQHQQQHQPQQMNGMMPGMPVMPGMMGMNGMPGMPNMGMGNMMPFPGMNPMAGFGMGMPNMGMGMGMPMGMMGMPGFNPMAGGFPNMNGAGMDGGGGNGMFGNGFGDMNGGGGMGGGMNNMNGPGQGVGMNGYGNHQQGGNGNYNNNNNGYQDANGNAYQPNNDNDAYFRKPVNPHRHQNRQRRVRPSDYREL